MAAPRDDDLKTSDERRVARTLLGRLEVRSWRQGAFASMCLVVALAVAYALPNAGLGAAGKHGLFILVFAAGLWITEAIPAFATGLVVMALAIVLLGDMGRTGASPGWERFVAPWASPIIWLFLGGFVLGAAASRTGLDRNLAVRALGAFGATPARMLLGLMIVGYVLSMFMSNTAATAMLLTVASPILASLPRGEPFRKALALGLPLSANVGGMGTIIGTPPNAIAAGALGEGTIDFARWMMIGIPPSFFLLLLGWFYLVRRHPPRVAAVVVPDISAATEALPAWRRIIVVVTIAATVMLWLTSSLHRVPTPVVSFLPITVFAAAGVLRSADVRGLGWDVLLLLAGGLALGVVVTDTGLARWVVDKIPAGDLGRIGAALLVAFLAAVLSNLMSNTAAATILVPVAIAIVPKASSLAAVSVALAASCAMCLPISTPPNAIAYATGELDSRDFLRVGLVVGVVGPVLSVAWASLLL